MNLVLVLQNYVWLWVETLIYSQQHIVIHHLSCLLVQVFRQRFFPLGALLLCLAVWIYCLLLRSGNNLRQLCCFSAVYLHLKLLSCRSPRLSFFGAMSVHFDY